MKKLLFLLAGGGALLLITAFALVACAPGGGTSQPTTPGVTTAAVQPERCGVCHEGAGEKHQAIYDKYTDKSKLELTIDSVSSDGTMTVTIKKDGAPYIDKDGLPGLAQKTFYTVNYDSATRTFDGSVSFTKPVALGDGKYSLTASGKDYKVPTNGQAYGYVADGKLDTESGGHVTMYDNVASAGKAFGDVASYESYANVSGCEKCHGTPYMKHGYRDPVVAGLSDFSSCKSCHYDTRTGGHQDWQVLVDNPARYAELLELAEAGAKAKDSSRDSTRENMTEDELTQYAYNAKLINDVHMAHAMEFPYPQSMSNCATCHEGKLDKVLAQDNFKISTCKSCHPVNGPEEGTEHNRAPALKKAMPQAIHGSMDLETTDCNTCHGTMAPAFNKIHTGYNTMIYADANGTKYSDKIAVSIDSASKSGNEITIGLSASGSAGGLNGADITPEVMIGLYGYDTKHFIVNGHDRYDSSGNGKISRADGDLPKGAYEVGTEHKYWKTVSETPGAWTITTDLTEWSDMIKDGTIRRVEISVLPMLDNADGEEVALNAPSRTFDLGKNAFDDSFFTDIVDVKNGCNKCHDALATTFHTPDRGGNIRVCRTCHVSLAGGAHLEMQSRSIDSYIHAIHSFQAFDPGDIDFTDPVQTTKYELHIEHVFPNFTIKNCESCHVEGTFEAPSEAISLPGILSGSDKIKGKTRNIGDVPSYVTGPGAKACGGCHRAHAINEDNAEELADFYKMMEGGGYLIENGDGVLDSVIKALYK